MTSAKSFIFIALLLVASMNVARAQNFKVGFQTINDLNRVNSQFSQKINAHKAQQ